MRVDVRSGSADAARETFRHGPDGARYERYSEWREGGAAKSARTFHVGAYEETLPESDAAVASVQRTRLPGGAVHVKTTPAQGAATETFEYRHLDHLGSAAAVSDGTGAALAVLGHDPFGARRRPDWTRGLTAAESAALPRRAARGFTGHEHLDRTGLVHTGGRLYDPVLGRFLSADPYVSEPDTGQGWNRYAYVSNSPLSRTDPTGHVQAGAWCQIAHAMCAEADGGGGGFGRESRTYRVPALAVVHVPYVRASWSLVYGRGPFGDGGWLRFVPRFVWGWRSLAIPYMAAGAVRVEGESPADEPMTGAASGDSGRIEPGALPGRSDAPNTLASTRFPSPEEILRNYPDPAGEYCSQAGNECAVRLSIALARSGVDISGSSRFGPIHRHSDGTVIQMGARPLADYLWATLGRPQIMDHPTGWRIEDFQGRSGIIYFVHPPGPDENGVVPDGRERDIGHIDILHGQKTGSGFYRNKKVWFWEYRNGVYGG